MGIKPLLASVSAFSLLATGAAGAQVDAAQVDAEYVSDQQIEEITVTGEKVARSLQDTPTSVAVINDIKLRDQNIINLDDVFERTANIASAFSGTSFSIRGINNTNVSGAGLSDLATIYVDGSPLSRIASFSGPLDIWDISQVEIFRGPQSTLQGRNTLAGAIIINTADPTYEWEGRVRAIASNAQDQRRLGVAVGGPIIKDQLAFRVAGELSSADGVIRNTVRNEQANASEAVFLRTKLLIEPAAVEDLRVELAYTYDDREFGSATVDLNATADFFSDREVQNNDPSFDNNLQHIAVATISYDFSDKVSFTSITSYNELDRDFANDGDLGPERIEFNNTTSHGETWVQEFQLGLDLGKLTGVFGAYYTDYTLATQGSTTFNIDIVNDLGLVNILVSGFGLDVATAQFVSGFYAEPQSINLTGPSDFSQEAYALFGDFTYQLTDDIRLFGGFRYDEEKQGQITEQTVTILGDLPDPAGFPATLAPLIAGINGIIVAQAENATEDRVELTSPTFKAFLPKFGIGWDIDDDRNLSFIAQRGYRSGGVGINNARAEVFQFDQEFIWNYELSFRSQWFDKSLTLNANAFYVDWEDQQVSVQLSDNIFDVATQNAGASRLYGFEIESVYYVNDEVELYGSVGFTDTEFTEFTAFIGGQPFDFSGNEFAGAPRWTLAGGVTWNDSSGLFLNINANYQTAGYARSDRPQDTRFLEARMLVNFKAGWQDENWGLFVTGDNIFEDEFFLTRFPLDPGNPAVVPGFGTLSQPRTFALQLEYRF